MNTKKKILHFIKHLFILKAGQVREGIEEYNSLQNSDENK